MLHKTIKFVCFDFDGVFTDGKFYFNNDGQVSKCYNAKDSLALKILNKKNILCGIITNDNVVSIKHAAHIFDRVNKVSIGIDYIDKINILNKWMNELNIDYSEVAYIGDDMSDITILSNIQFSGCPNDAVPEVKKVCNYILNNNCGNGAVREFVEKILKYNESIVLNKPIELLDCTIRDGGYLNNWLFSDEEVLDCYKTVSEAGFDYFEIGFRTTPCSNCNLGKWYYSTEEDINIICNSFKGCKIAVMAKCGTVDISDFIPKTESNVSMVRVLLGRVTVIDNINICEYNENSIKKARIFCEQLINLGYEVCVNFGCCDLITDYEIKLIVNEFNNVPIKYMYLADTYGGCDKGIVQKQINKFTTEFNNYNSTQNMGFHSHNNNENSLEKTQVAILSGCKIIDMCIGGLGRGAGNLKTEIFLCEQLKHDSNMLLALQHICEYYNKYIMSKEVYKNNKSLYHPYYAISGALSLHPDYIDEILLNSNSSTVDDIKLIKLLDSHTREFNCRNYDKGLITKLM